MKEATTSLKEVSTEIGLQEKVMIMLVNQKDQIFRGMSKDYLIAFPWLTVTRSDSIRNYNELLMDPFETLILLAKNMQENFDYTGSTAGIWIQYIRGINTFLRYIFQGR